MFAMGLSFIFLVNRVLDISEGAFPCGLNVYNFLLNENAVTKALPDS